MSGSDETIETENDATAPDPSQEAAADGVSSQDSRIESLEAELAALRDQALRARAEVENVLRRTEREKQDIAAYAISGFARDLLSVSDNLRRTLDALPDALRGDGAVKIFVDGVEMTERDILAAFQRHGIEKITPKGERFDHNFHQAMAEVESDQPPGTVVDVYQPGYVLKGRLLRPAMVTVAKAAGKAEGRIDTSA